MTSRPVSFVARAAAALALLSVVSVVISAQAPPPPAAAPTPAATLLSGTLVGADGRPMRAADVRLFRPGGDPVTLAATRVDSTGHFAIATIARGTVVAAFTGVNHESRYEFLLLGDGTPLAVDVRLGRPRVPATFDSVAVRGDGWASTRAMTRQPDGRWVLETEVPGDSLRYTLDTFAPHARAALTDPDAGWFTPGPLNGPYFGVTHTRHGVVRASFDPRRAATDSTVGALAWRDTASTAVRYALLLRAFEEADGAYATQRSAESVRRASLLREDVARWDARLATERDPALRQLLILHLLRIAGSDGALPVPRLATLVGMLDFTHPAWGGRDAEQPGYLYLDALGRVAGLPDSAVGVDRTWRDSAVFARYRAEVARVLASNAAEGIKGALLEPEIVAFQGLGRREDAQRVYQQIAAQYPHTWKLPLLRARYDVAASVRVGQPIPTVAFPALDGTARYGPTFFASHKLTLIDFWATWCGPCVLELPNIQKIVARYRGRGFDVLSVSVDDTPDAVRRFRATKQPMRWAHAWAPGGLSNDIVRRWEVSGVPRAVLVDRNGVVVALDAAVRGDQLDATLARMLAGPAAPAR